MTRWIRLVALVWPLASCGHQLDGPAPTVSGVSPDIICTEQLDTTVTLSGDGLSPLAIDALTDDPKLALPAITLTRVKDLAGQTVTGPSIKLPDDPADPAASIVEWHGLTSMSFTVSPALALEPGVYDILVENGNGNSFTASDVLGAVPAPAVDSVEPDLVCVAQGGETITITGAAFLRHDGVLPTVTIGGEVFAADAVDSCTPVGGGALDGADLCTSLSVTIPMDGLAEGAHSVTVTNPEPAHCSSLEDITVAVVPPPVIDGFNPNPVCNINQVSTIDITGSGFLRVDGALPAVMVNGSAVTVTGAAGCTLVDGTTREAETCTSVTIEIAQGTLGAGDHEVVLQNPAPADCITETSATLTAVDVPEVLSVVPTSLCVGGGDILIQGAGFASTVQVSIGGVALNISTVSADGTEIYATLGPGLEPGTYDVTVDNGDGCAVTQAGSFIVTPGPAVFFVDPTVVYNGVSVQATLYISGLAVAPAQVTIRPTGTTDSTPLIHTWNPLKPNRILATIPAGLTPGDWDVVVDDGSCNAILPQGFTVTDTLTVAIDTIDPPFGWTEETTAVSITAVDPAPAGLVQFQATPRVYLNPDAASPTTLASNLEAVVYVDDTRLTAIVPQGLTPGLYDLIVINADGSVGLLDNAFTVTETASPPPIIDDVTPASVIDQTGQTVQILGQNFRNSMVDATCEDSNGVVHTIAGTVGTFTATAIDATFDMSVVTGGGICVIRVLNDDGTYADYSAVAVSNPAQNLPPTGARTDMTVARRALGADAGRVTAQSRFLYAIGGDDGATPLTRHSSVEAAPVDPFGNLGAWSLLPAQSSLPQGRSLAHVVNLGRFLYLVGGSIDAGATDSVLRAQILDPQDSPDITDVVFEYGDGAAGLDGGLYYYLVSAVMAPTDPSNPGGETLASDPLAVRVPPLAQKILLTLTWSAVPGAVEYRVYRTPDPNLLVGTAALIATVSTTSYIDNGTAAGTDQPLPVGSLGIWHDAGLLSASREGAGVAIAPDPAQSSLYYLYAIGGRDDTGAALRSYDVAPITVAADGSQTVAPFVPGGDVLGVGRWQLGAVVANYENSSVVPLGESWIFAMAGLNAAGTGLVSDTTAARVGAGGLLDSITETDDMQPARAGYAFAVANNFLFAFGGAMSTTGAPRGDAGSAELCAVGDPMCNGGPPEPADLVNWNALGFSLTVPRYLPGTALESAFMFIVGGATDTATATTSTESTHW